MFIEQIKKSDSMLLDKIKEFDIPVVKVIERFDDDIQSLISYTRKLKNAEGFILAFDDGHKLKIKADDYVRIHKTKDMIRSNRHIVALMLDNQLDDIFPHLDAGDLSRVKSFEIDFWNSIDKKVQYISEEVDKVIEKYSGDRKRIAIEEVPKLADKTLPTYIYGKIGGKNIRDMVMDTLNKNMNADIRFEEFWQWIKIVK